MNDDEAELAPCAAEHAGFLAKPLPALDDEEGARVPDALPPIVDAHVHLFPDRLFAAVWRWFDRWGWPVRYRLDAPEVVRHLLTRGVEHMVALHYAHKPGIADGLNRFMADVCRAEPRLSGVATVFPGEPDACGVLERGFALGLCGVKLHCHVQCVGPDDPSLREIYALCAERDLPLVMHAGREPAGPGYACNPHALCSADRVERVLGDFPRLRLCVPHLGMDEYDAYERLLERFDNLWLDTTMAVAEYFPGPPPLRLLQVPARARDVRNRFSEPPLRLGPRAGAHHPPRAAGERARARARRNSAGFLPYPVKPWNRWTPRRTGPMKTVLEEDTMKLYENPLSPNARRTLLVVEHLGLDVELKVLDFMKGEHKAPEFLKLNPNGKVPVLVDGDFALNESRAIMQYLAAQKPESGLLPADEKGRADVVRWQFWDAAHFSPQLSTIAFERLMKPMMGIGDPDESAIAAAEKNLVQFAAVLDGHLHGRRYVVGDELTIADFTLASSLSYAGPSGVSLDPYPDLKAWFGRISELEAWKKTTPKLG